MKEHLVKQLTCLLLGVFIVGVFVYAISRAQYKELQNLNDEWNSSCFDYISSTKICNTVDEVCILHPNKIDISTISIYRNEKNNTYGSIIKIALNDTKLINVTKNYADSLLNRSIRKTISNMKEKEKEIKKGFA